MNRFQKLYSASLALAVAVMASPALASDLPTSVPEPGILGLVAMGVVGTLLVARKRK